MPNDSTCLAALPPTFVTLVMVDASSFAWDTCPQLKPFLKQYPSCSCFVKILNKKEMAQEGRRGWSGGGVSRVDMEAVRFKEAARVRSYQSHFTSP